MSIGYTKLTPFSKSKLFEILSMKFGTHYFFDIMKFILSQKFFNDVIKDLQSTNKKIN